MYVYLLSIDPGLADREELMFVCYDFDDANYFANAEFGHVFDFDSPGTQEKLSKQIGKFIIRKYGPVDLENRGAHAMALLKQWESFPEQSGFERDSRGNLSWHQVGEKYDPGRKWVLSLPRRFN